LKKIFIGFVIFVFYFFITSCNSKEKSENSNLRSDSLKKLSNETIFTDTLNTYKLSYDFDYCEYKLNIDLLLFRFKKPIDFDSSKKYPLLIFFHGAGERGSDNESQLTHIKQFLEINKSDYSFYTLAPQCPENTKWVDADWTLEKSVFADEPTLPMKLTINLITKLCKSYNIDTNRIYVVGISMGGFAVWDIISRMSYKFAAAVPICGGGDEQKAKDIGNIPIWAFHGAKDKLVKVSRSRNMVYALKENGIEIKYSEIKDVGHNVWENAFNNAELYKWIFEQNKIKNEK